MAFVHYLNPWKLKRDRQAARLAALRARDGDNCARCRRPLRFDLPPGHDQGCQIEPLTPGLDGETEADFRLCHPRCNPSGVDHTDEVTTRARLKNEAALFERSRQNRAA
jgi:hypothetical protein